MLSFKWINICEIAGDVARANLSFIFHLLRYNQSRTQKIYDSLVSEKNSWPWPHEFPRRFCLALYCLDERLENSSKRALVFGWFCAKGDISLAPFRSPAEPLRVLFTSTNSGARVFCKSTSQYNSSLAFTSLNNKKQPDIWWFKYSISMEYFIASRDLSCHTIGIPHPIIRLDCMIPRMR